MHARRTQILSEEHRPLVFNTKSPQSIATFLVGGQVAGTWTEQKGKVKAKPFAPLPRARSGRSTRRRRRLEGSSA